MRKYKHFLAIVLVLALLGCSNQEIAQQVEPQADAGNADEPITLRVHYGDSTREYYGDRMPYFEKVKRIIEGRHDNLRIEWTTSIHAADLLTLGTWQTDFDYANTVDLFPYLERDGIDLTEIYKPLLEMHTIDGKLVGIPGYPQPLVVFYNKAWFDKANLPYPDGSWTAEEFINTLNQLKEANVVDDDQPVLHMMPGVDTEPLVLSAGGQMIGPDGKTLEGYLDDSKTVKVIEWVVGLYRDKLAAFAIHENPKSNRNIGVTIAWSSLYADLGNLPKDHPWQQDHVGVALLPQFDGGSRVTTTSSYISVIPKSAKHPDLAWEFMKELYLTNEELAVERARTDLLITKALVQAADQERHEIYGPLIQDYANLRQSGMFRNRDWFITAISIGRKIVELAKTDRNVKEALIEYAGG